MQKITLIAAILIACCGHLRAQSPGSRPRAHQRQRASALSFDSALANSLHRDTEKKDTAINRKILQLMIDFGGRTLDTTIAVVGNLEGLGSSDTIATRVYLARDTVFVEELWLKSGDTLWESKGHDPYIYVNDSKTFSADTRSRWVIFATGVFYSIPSFESKNLKDLEDIALQGGLEYLKGIGVNVSEGEYRRYLEEFTGELLDDIPEPEAGDDLYIWYAPAKKLVPFYTP